MTAVLILVNASAVSVSGWVLVFGIILSAVLGALAQWIASAKTKRLIAVRTARSVVGAATTLVMGYMFVNCGWVWEWICFSF